MMKRNRSLLIAITVIMLVILTSCGKIKIDKSSADYARMNYQEVSDELTKLGFNNISSEEIADLASKGQVPDGAIESVTVSGESFEAGSSFPKNAEILIKYHTFRTIPMPIGPDEIEGMDYKEIGKLITDSGFTSVTVNEVYDIDPGTAQADHVNEVTVSGSADFNKGDAVPFDADIAVNCHYPYEIFNVKLIIDFQSNLFLDKYDVEFSIDDKQIADLKHGEDWEVELQLKNGTHTLSFITTDDPYAEGEADLEVTNNTEAKFVIKTHSETIDVNAEYVYSESDVGENQVRITWTKYDLEGKGYKKIISEIQSAGFTNIKEKPIYDITYNTSSVGLTDYVTIDGSTDYSSGDIFDKDVEVVVPYHLMEEDDPNKPKEFPESGGEGTTGNAATETEEKADEQEDAGSENDAPKKETTFNSTNDEETAKLGNSGKFAYINRLSNYDMFYIIDFDEGLVYSFIYGQGDETGTAYVIESGDLNNGLIAKYDVEGDENDFSFVLHFHYVNNPDVLIEDLGNYGETKYQATSIEDALKLKDNYEF